MIYKQTAQKLLRFENPVKVYTKDDPRSFLNQVIKSDPRVFFYFGGCSFSKAGDCLIMKVQYENCDFPTDRVYIMHSTIDETIFRNAVANYEPCIVFIVPVNSNLEWSLKKFRETSIAFYPSFTGMSSSVKSIDGIPYQCYEIHLKYRIGSVWLKMMNQEVDQKISELKPFLLSSEYPDSVKCLLAHNYLASSIEYYDLEKENPLERNYVQSAYGALIKHKCVCQGYAEAFKRLMDAANIKCDIISGKVTQKDGSYEWHAWNIVELKKFNLASHVDCTWDSRNGRAYSEHFLKGDDFYLESREWNRYMYRSGSEATIARNEAFLYCKMNYSNMIKKGLKLEWIKFEDR